MEQGRTHQEFDVTLVEPERAARILNSYMTHAEMYAAILTDDRSISHGFASDIAKVAAKAEDGLAFEPLFEKSNLSSEQHVRHIVLTGQLFGYADRADGVQRCVDLLTGLVDNLPPAERLQVLRYVETSTGFKFDADAQQDAFNGFGSNLKRNLKLMSLRKRIQQSRS